MNNKSNFSSRIGFIFAAAGSAVGLGNIWRFPYLAAKYGGGTFLFIYLILAISFGFTLMITEIAIGRKTGKSVLYAFSSLNKKYSFLGILASIVPMIIFPYYCVIGGWVAKYFATFISNPVKGSINGDYFNGFITQVYQPIFWLSLFILATTLIVMLGVEKGIEKASKFLMPLLIILSIGLAIYIFTLKEAKEGILYYLMPDMSRFSFQAVLAAMGQLFYSMSLAMGIMVTYGSYVSKKENLEASVRNIELFDTAIAFISGLIIVPAVFAFSGGDESVLTAGAGLMFITLPEVFANLKLGSLIGIAFFLLVLFAALTSAISLMETIVAVLQEKFKIKRIPACLLVACVAFIIGIPSSLGFGIWSNIKILDLSILDFFDFISNAVLMPIVAFLTCIFVGYIIKPEALIKEVEESAKFKSKKIYIIVIKYIAPVLILLILISSILNTFGLITL